MFRKDPICRSSFCWLSGFINECLYFTLQLQDMGERGSKVVCPWATHSVQQTRQHWGLSRTLMSAPSVSASNPDSHSRRDWKQRGPVDPCATSVCQRTRRGGFHGHAGFRDEDKPGYRGVWSEHLQRSLRSVHPFTSETQVYAFSPKITRVIVPVTAFLWERLMVFGEGTGGSPIWVFVNDVCQISPGHRGMLPDLRREKK